MPARPPRQRLRRAALAVPLLAALVVPTTAGAAEAKSDGKGSRPDRPVTQTYSNPLEPVVPGDGTVDSCADPIVLQGQQEGDDNWYMWCTTDPLNDDDRDADGNLVFNKIPQLVSTDLVSWTYVGNAFVDNPSWAEPDAGLWAPDVVYSSAFDQYYMFVTVTDTVEDVSGEADCDGDSAIGVATSASPTGPWTFSEEPVVAPRRGGAGCNFLWTYDPDVLGDSVGTESVFYYGSYYGGIFAAPITFTADGATADVSAQTQVTIANKYEGANVVERDGWYYLFVSATNCCNGALTGYSVFVGRSESPYGPFLDREGNSLLALETGGTPVISMNGNRWVGTGHNSVFQDESGQWWTAYHAVDQQDPFFEGEPGFTKRPVLLDPIDWVDGWPTVRGGLWASDRKMFAPAAQEGQRSKYRTRLVAPQEPGRLLSAEEFDSGLDGWRWVREPDPSTYEVSGGVLTWDVQKAELYEGFNTAAVLTTDAPRGDYVVETRVRLDVPVDPPCCYNYAQAGLVVYGDDDNYIKLVEASIWETRQTEFAKEWFPVPIEGQNRYGNTVVGPPARDWTYLRIAVERLNGREQRDAGGDTHSYTGYTSQDGTTWVRGGTWTHTLGDAEIALVSMGLQDDVAQEVTAEFDYVRTYALQPGRRG